MYGAKTSSIEHRSVTSIIHTYYFELHTLKWLLGYNNVHDHLFVLIGRNSKGTLNITTAHIHAHTGNTQRMCIKTMFKDLDILNTIKVTYYISKRTQKGTSQKVLLLCVR